MKFNPETYELEVDYDDINEERRMFLINGGKLSLSALLLAGFIPISTEANPVLFFRVIAGPVIKYFSKKTVKKFVKRTVRTVNTVSAGDTLSGNMLSSAARDLVISRKGTSIINAKVNEMEQSVPNSIWSQSGRHKVNGGSNKISIIIANNSGREVAMPSTEVASFVDRRDNKEEIKLKLKRSRVEPGITIVETKIINLPRTGVKKIITKNRQVAKARQHIVIATDDEVRINRNTASQLFEKYVTNHDYRTQPIPQQYPEIRGDGAGTKLYKQYMN